LALFCAACPQVGINLPSDWKQDNSNSWKYALSLAADGNFSLVHRKQKGTDYVWLKNGEGFLVAQGPYMDHLKHAAKHETHDVSPEFILRDTSSLTLLRNLHAMSIEQSKIVPRHIKGAT
jgi:hypothetical protein